MRCACRCSDCSKGDQGLSGAFPCADNLCHPWNDDRFFYAIVMGPTTLETPQPMLQPGSFHVIACLVGVVLVLGMQWAKEKRNG